MRRASAPVLAAFVGAAIVAGCTGGSSGADASSSASASPSVTRSGSPTISVVPSTPVTTSAPPSSGANATPAPTATASIAQPPDPVVESGNAGAWSLTRAAPGTADTRQISSVQCGQDGSVTATGLALSAGGTSLTLLDPAVTVAGTAQVDAAGGTFRGRNTDTAVTFTWTC